MEMVFYQIPQHAKYMLKKFKLLPHSLGRIMAGLNKSRIVLSSIEAIIKPDE
jgi:hypothetical protein